MKKAIFSTLALSLLVSLSASADVATFKEILKDADLGNGTGSVGHFDTRVSKADLIAKGLEQMKRERWEKCGPWKVTDSRRTGIRKIRELESNLESSKTADRLERLYREDKIVAILGNESNNEIECSLSWFNIYGTDGSLLKLRYNMGD